MSCFHKTGDVIKKIVFQEDAGYSEDAALKYFGNLIEGVRCKTLTEVFKILEEGKADYSTVPVENSMEGSVGQTHDLLLRHDLKICGEVYVTKGNENNHDYTRFLIVSKNDSEPTGNDKTSIIFSTKHEPGALYRALGTFSERKINLTRVKSRPIVGRPWEYNFYLDFEGHRRDEVVSKALEELKDNSLFVKIIGSYPKAKENSSVI